MARTHSLTPYNVAMTQYY